MRALFCALAFLFAFAGNSAINPITDFPWETYLVQGNWLADDGSSGNYASNMAFSGDGWTTSQFRLMNLYIYENVLDIDQDGFFTAEVTDVSDPNNPVEYSGFGNCGTMQCQITVELNNGTLQKSLIFVPNTNYLYSFGAIYFNDGTPDVQWEEMGILLP